MRRLARWPGVVLAATVSIASGGATATGPKSVLDDFLARRPSAPGGLPASEVLDFDNPTDRGFVYRLELDVTSDGAADVFLAVGPTGREGTTWFIYSPGLEGRYRYVGELFFHPGSFCYVAHEGVFRIGRRCGESDPVTGHPPWAAVDYVISASRVRRTKTFTCRDTEKSLEPLLSCADSADGLAAYAYDAKHAKGMWLSFRTWTPAARQPKPLSALLMRDR